MSRPAPDPTREPAAAVPNAAAEAMARLAGRRRVVVERLSPEVDAGRYPAKRTLGDRVVIEVDAFTDGHDLIHTVLRWRKVGASEWTEVPMLGLVNDRWRASFEAAELGRYEYTVEAWVDPFASWRRDMGKWLDAKQDVGLALQIGANLAEETAARAGGADAERLRQFATDLRNQSRPQADRATLGLSQELHALMLRFPDRTHATRYPQVSQVSVDPVRARFGSWYEFFPRSTADGEPGRHGTWTDAERRLPYVHAMGFDVVYLPPIHPIGVAHRKGKNNSLTPAPDDVGSPWAIGGAAGGHREMHPQLGSLGEFRGFVARARDEFGIDIAMDIAFQVSPDHPYVREHAEWFRKRPDGTIQYAENPPKKYQDIYPFDFDSADWREMWTELTEVVRFWTRQGVRIFRVDNPHTKALPFWEYLIGEIKREVPDAIFLAEAFTRPKVMYNLAKSGFNQSYTYFAWRREKWEIEEYLEELTQTEVHDFFRPSFWPNTPDILTDQLQTGHRPLYVQRLVLAATLAASYGIYGPPFELLEHRPAIPGKEEYLDSEKYQLRHWKLDQPHSLAPVIAHLNRIRRDNPALQANGSLQFHPTENRQLIAYSKHNGERPADADTAARFALPLAQNPQGYAGWEADNVVLCVVNLDPYTTQTGFVEFPLEQFGIRQDEPYQVVDLLGGARYTWSGRRNYVALDPNVSPAHLFRVERPRRPGTHLTTAEVEAAATAGAPEVTELGGGLGA